MAEADYYENLAEWDVDRYLADDAERKRFEVTAGMISADATRLLDVGTGNGAFLSFLEGREAPLTLCGLERAKSAISAAQCRTEIVEGPIDALPFGDRSYDTVTALEVIEHLPHGVYSKALAEMARVADSQVLISVPYRERRLMVVCPECGCRFSPIFHLRTFDERTLERLVPGFRLSRFELVTIEVHWLLTAVATRVRGLRDRLRGHIPVPTTCPQCDFRLGPAQRSSVQRGSAGGGQGRSLRSTLLDLVPKAKRAHWIVASYERMQ